MGRRGDQRRGRASGRAARAVLLALLAVLPSSAPAAQSVDRGSYEARLFSLLNAERRRHGLRPLRAASCAGDFASSWASRIAHDGALRHQSVRRVLRSCRADRAAENVARGNVTPERMMELWMHSRGHRRNILDPRLTHVGLGAAQGSGGQWFGVQVFLGYAGR